MGNAEKVMRGKGRIRGRDTPVHTYHPVTREETRMEKRKATTKLIGKMLLVSVLVLVVPITPASAVVYGELDGDAHPR
jgi:hypothetical protein